MPVTANAEGRDPPADRLGRVMAAVVPGMSEMQDELPAAVGFPALTPARLTPPALLSILGLQVLDALYRLPPERVRSCPRCGWLFHDTSKGGRRKWCSMRDCGKREKAARHYPRPQTGPGRAVAPELLLRGQLGADPDEGAAGQIGDPAFRAAV